VTDTVDPPPLEAPDDRRARRLTQEAARAAELRALSTNPDVVALRTEKVRAQVDVCAWASILLGLGFTAVNVQQFAAAGAGLWSLGWCAAWLIDPMVSLLLIGVVRTEQITARWQVETPRVVRVTKWGTFAATYVMNTWQAWTGTGWAPVVLHSVPPIMVLIGASVAPVLRDRLTEAVMAAETRTLAQAPASGLAEVSSASELVPPSEEEQEEPQENTGNEEEERAEDAALTEPPPPARTEHKMHDAKMWFRHEYAQGRTPPPVKVNEWIGSEGYIKTRHVEAWTDELKAEAAQDTGPVLRAVGE
jgi:hypothetical protein